jgi:hypothetical protein
MMPQGTPEQVLALRQQLWDAGFRPVPIYNHDADHPSAGKAPRGADWGDKARLDPPLAAVSEPAADALNTGILCDGLRAIDIDIDNPTIAHSIRAKALDMFGEAPMRHRSNSARTLLLYRAAVGAPVKRAIAGTFGKVEVLGRGQQFVGFGVHPSGADLQWMPEAPGEIDIHTLPAITEDQITAFLASCAPSIGAKPEEVRTGEAAPNAKLGADGLQVVAAVSAIPNNGPADWEAWNRIGMAIWAATSGSEAGRAIWHAWSEQHPAYDHAATAARWDHYRTSPPARIGAGTLFYEARKYDQPMELPPDDASFFDTMPDATEPQIIPPDKPRIPIVFWDDIKPNTDARDFVEGMFLDESMSVIYGQSNSGKTFWMADVAMHVAAGLEWRGLAVEQRGVAWVAMEGSHGIYNRIEAWRLEHGMENTTLPFVVIPVALDLLNPDADTGPLIAALQAAQERLGMPFGLIVVDTLSRAMAGGNENAPDDMGALVTNGTRIQQTVKAHVAWIHHAGKDDAKGARGHSLLRAATDTEIEISAEGSQRQARVTKQRELDCSGEYGFTLRIVELGKNRRGKPVTTCVVEHNTGAVDTTKRRLEGHNKRAFDVLANLIAASGKVGYAGVPAGAPSVPEDWWRDAFYSDAMPGDKDETKKKAFDRANKHLINNRIVGMAKRRVWISFPDDNYVPGEGQN